MPAKTSEEELNSTTLSENDKTQAKEVSLSDKIKKIDEGLSTIRTKLVVGFVEAPNFVSASNTYGWLIEELKSLEYGLYLDPRSPEKVTEIKRILTLLASKGNPAKEFIGNYINDQERFLEGVKDIEHKLQTDFGTISQVFQPKQIRDWLQVNLAKLETGEWQSQELKERIAKLEKTFETLAEKGPEAQKLVEIYKGIRPSGRSVILKPNTTLETRKTEETKITLDEVTDFFESISENGNVVAQYSLLLDKIKLCLKNANNVLEMDLLLLASRAVRKLSNSVIEIKDGGEELEGLINSYNHLRTKILEDGSHNLIGGNINQINLYEEISQSI